MIDFSKDIKGEVKMLKNYISELNNWFQWLVNTIVEEEYFLYIMGSIFLLGIVTKWVVVKNYGKLIRKAENMTNPKNVTLRQIKMKFEGIKQVDGYVSNPMLLVRRHLSKCRVGIVSLNKLNVVINWCSILAVVIGGAIGLELYVMNSERATAISYVLIGAFVAYVLEIIDRNSKVKDKEMELAYTIVDFLENGVVHREDKLVETVNDIMQQEAEQNENQREEQQKKYHEEQILNQVIGEFLQ